MFRFTSEPPLSQSKRNNRTALRSLLGLQNSLDTLLKLLNGPRNIQKCLTVCEHIELFLTVPSAF